MRARSFSLLVAALLASACESDPASPSLQAAVAGLFRDAAALEVGEVLTVTAEDAQLLVLAGGENGAEYVYIPFNGSEKATDQLSLRVTGANIPGATGQPTPSLAPAPGTRSSIPGPFLGPQEDGAFHLRLRQREIDQLRPLLRGSAARGFAAARAPLDAPPSIRVGDTLSINVNAEQACRNPDLQQARVVAVSDHAVVLEDVANPTGGFSPEEYRHVAAVFDTLIYPVSVRNFGEPILPAFADLQNRVIIFYTRAVNELTQPGSNSFVGGFFFARDIFPREPQGEFEACPASNQAPILYLLAPDPSGQAGNVRPRAFVLQVTLGTVAHELQHLINQARRIFVTAGAEPFEEVWLNEGLSHIAEELMFYHTTRLSPRQNIDAATLRSSAHVLEMFRTYQVSNFGRYIQYLENPDTSSLLGVDNLPTRGASWAFLRYAADHEDGPDAPFFRRLVDGTGAGVRNLAAALPVDPIDLMQRWTVSVYTDDALPTVAFPFIYQQPSWNFRSVITGFKNAQGTPQTAGYPLQVRSLTAQEQTFRLKGGGAAFFRFAVPARERATLATTAGESVPLERLRISVVRIR